MPYILSPSVKIGTPGLWAEGIAYQQNSLYEIDENKLPPVNYSEHLIKPHSITHAEGELHVLKNGKNIESYFSNPDFFYGPCIVIKLKGNNYKKIDDEKNIYLWEVTLSELKSSLSNISSKHSLQKLLITTEFYPVDDFGYHDSNYVLILSEEAAKYLTTIATFNLYGTSWKSSDYQPGKLDRPIHKIIFKKAIIFELLNLKDVPEGEYLFIGFPVRLENASESPVTPVLFKKGEMPVL